MAVTWPRSARSDRPVMSTAGSVLTVASLGAPPAAGRPRRAQQPGAPAKPLNPEFNGTQPVQRHIERVAGRHAHRHARAWLTVGTGGQACWAGLAGTSSAGLRSKKPTGLSQNETVSTGITGQSSGRVMWWMPNTYHSTTSVFSIDRSRAVQTGRP